ncbi:TonB-dependent receptor plug domain-containing protein [Hahella sp. SMD15-11]|uniref:TonB-dependent receptor plug domain-containing protein n=1 Tax=Thermohahella caldifontis TaxID=3142973 RepID=A0AB39UT15_9GAMM
MKQRFLVTSLSLLALSNAALASYLLDTLVVTGTRTERMSSDAPLATYTIDRATLDALNTHRADDLLRRLPGIQITKLHGKTGYRVQMQGLEGRHVLILLDGQPLPSLSDGTVDVSRIPLDTIERIEVVPGASSALYGSQAMGGVIQLFSRKGRDTDAEISLEGVSYGPDSTDTRFPDRRHVSAQGSIPIGEVLTRVHAHHTEDEGLAVRDQTFSTTGEQGRRTGGGISLSREISGWQLGLNTDVYRQVSGYRYGITSPGSTGVATRPWQKQDKLDQVRTQATLRGGDVAEHEIRLLREDSRETTLQDQLETPGIERERHAEHRMWNLDALSRGFAGDDHQWVLGFAVNRETLSQSKSEGGRH